MAQIGNPQYPPKEGDTISIAVSVTDHETAESFDKIDGAVVRDYPVGKAVSLSHEIVLSVKRKPNQSGIAATRVNGR